MLQRLIASSRFLVVVPILCIAALMLAILLYGAALTVETVGGVIREGVSSKTTKTLLLGTVELADLFLVGTTLYIIAIGLFELFIHPNLPTLPWLKIKSLDDLKAKVLSMVIVVLAVYFLGQALAGVDGQQLVMLGGSIALVIGALTYFIGQKSAA